MAKPTLALERPEPVAEFRMGDVKPPTRVVPSRQMTAEEAPRPQAERDLLDPNVHKMEKFLKEVEASPESLVSIIESKRARCFGEKVPFRDPTATAAKRSREKQRDKDLLAFLPKY
eukprot:CAMPEP_0181413034 /NCGR_PEP_ID=MMETSP1110-20121109/8748_1 /TAXON_ID=174948 /ORGANISM="Symbiodinium sp., Strain CCMP421" /LENGTH=115 /DNA_ID=CAMNT_0023535803 /DNA_START=127 /DNA_END=474 /DNA_ORIENTATION=+